MASFHGSAGSVTFAGGATAKVTDFTLDISVDVADDNGMGDVYKSRLPGLKDWTASVTANCAATPDPGLADLGVVLQNLVLDTVTGFIFTATAGAIITNLSFSVSVDGVAQCTYEVMCSGSVVPTLVAS